MKKKEEAQFQINLFFKLSRLELKYDDLFVYAVEFGGAKNDNWGELRELKAKGMRKGISDLHVMGNGKMLFLELKTGKGSQSVAQKNFEAKAEKNGMKYMLAKSNEGVDAVVERVIGYLYG